MKKKAETETYSGLLDGHFETGSEGTHWVLDITKERRCVPGRPPKYVPPIFIEPGDHLKIYGESGEPVFDGIIVPDTKTGWMEYPKNPGYGQQCALGFWIHWIQKGWKPDDWAMLFIKHWLEKWKNSPRRRAELTKKPKRTR